MTNTQHETERWVDIPGYDGRYQVSDQGRVRATLIWTGGGYRPGIRVLRPRDNGRNYMRVLLRRPDGTAKNEQISHLVAAAFCANPNNCSEVDHINADRRDNRAANLQWCDHSSNILWGYDRRRRAATQPPKTPKPRRDPDQWRSVTGHKYVHPRYRGDYAVIIKGVRRGVYPTIEAAVAARNQIMGWSP